MRFLSSGFVTVGHEFEVWDWLQYAQVIWLEALATSDRAVGGGLALVPVFLACWVNAPMDRSLAATSLSTISIMVPNSHSPSFSSLLIIRRSSVGNLLIETGIKNPPYELD